MARRPGPIRLAVQQAAQMLVGLADGPRYGDEARPGVTYLDLQRHLVPQGVGRQAVRRTLEQLVRDGQMGPVAEVRLAHSKRPLKAYAPAADDGPQPNLPLGLDLQALLCGRVAQGA